MSDSIIALVSALIGGGLVAWVNYQFGLRHAIKQKRTEVVVSHLITAYLALEDYALREPNSPKHKERAAAIESAIAAIFLFGDNRAIELVRELDRAVKEGQGFNVKNLAEHLRDTLRKELMLDELEDKRVIHFRGPSE